MASTFPQKPAKNPGFTTLKVVGRQHRNEPFHLVYRVILYPKKGKLEAQALNDWCATRYLDDTRAIPRTRWRIETYRHKDGKKYVNRVMFERISEEELIELKLLFGTVFQKERVVRDGRIRRPRLNAEELEERNAWLDKFYMDIALRRQAARDEREAAVTA